MPTGVVVATAAVRCGAVVLEGGREGGGNGNGDGGQAIDTIKGDACTQACVARYEGQVVLSKTCNGL